MTTPMQQLRNKTRNTKEAEINRAIRAIPNLPYDWEMFIGTELDREN